MNRGLLHLITMYFALYWIWTLLAGYIGCNRLEEFPKSFQFGSASSAYQIEGGWNADGKGESMWDQMLHEHPEGVVDGTNGDVAADSYHRHREDVKMLKNIGVDFYRFSISWSRVLPLGSTSVINDVGLQYYDNLITELLAVGIQPMITIYHWDMPKTLQEFGGFFNPKIVPYFVDYADLLFSKYGDRVRTWITFNEPYTFCHKFYSRVNGQPFYKFDENMKYKCTHHVLLANAKVYDLYKTKFANFTGRIGITVNGIMCLPKDANNASHVESAERHMQFDMGQYTHPIFSKAGNYPKVMRDLIDEKSRKERLSVSRLPAMNEDERNVIKGKADFLGINYYTSRICKPMEYCQSCKQRDDDVDVTADHAWPRAQSDWLFSYPDGLRKLLNWIKHEYGNPEVLITENGWSDSGELEDIDRINYLRDHLKTVLEAINDGCNVTAHTTWSIMDNFEWSKGYTERFGLYKVDFDSPNRTRTPKSTVAFLRNVIETRRIPENDVQPNGSAKENRNVHIIFYLSALFISFLLFRK